MKSNHFSESTCEKSSFERIANRDYCGMLQHIKGQDCALSLVIAGKITLVSATKPRVKECSCTKLDLTGQQAKIALIRSRLNDRI